MRKAIKMPRGHFDRKVLNARQRIDVRAFSAQKFGKGLLSHGEEYISAAETWCRDVAKLRLYRCIWEQATLP